MTKSFGGNVLTTTDFALRMKLGPTSLPAHLNLEELITESDCELVLADFRKKLEYHIDKMRTSDELVPLILVGGGNIIIPDYFPLEGVSRIIKGEDFEYANAIGAALSCISSTMDTVVSPKEGITHE
eukprot:CAMPEP_0201283292 /NCGR_PEP_ID=MMETSP1317-20130820/8175_1 /ASSEMBLY_ACC=CAM_ASM_000770 /TAXON_ID=187299 /ORGANISM="Undescribed Undescribed, Strain Undescribed" /LENGTH=126 /DNA_ID=CAMNT_0047599049 /DNA_START=55 /DNA_END=438 /DNA_ORIENTATION=-